jgi:hypothetical protein
MKLAKKFRNNFWHYQARLRLFFTIKRLGLGKNDWIFLIDYGIGDTLFFYSLMKEFKQKNGGRIVLISRGGREKIVKMFSDIDFYITLDSRFVKIDSKRICNSDLIEKGKIFVPHPLSNKAIASMTKIIGYKDFTLLDMYKIIIGLPADSDMAKPNFEVYDIVWAKDFLKQNDCDPQRTIMIFPSANSVKPIGKEFWIELILQFAEKGFKIIANSGPEGDFFKHKNVINLNMHLTKTAAIGLVVNSVIASRSGICDLLAMGDRKITALYPSVDSQKSLSLVGMFAKNKNLTELVINESKKQKETIKQIVSTCG